MAWTAPVTQTTGYVVTASDWNVQVSDLLYLYGDTTWTSITTFTNSWTTQSGQVARYRLVGSLVAMNGFISTGSIGSAAFTLPAGYRPSALTQYPTNSNSLYGQFSISSAGVVTPQVGSNSSFSISCVFCAL